MFPLNFKNENRSLFSDWSNFVKKYSQTFSDATTVILGHCFVGSIANAIHTFYRAMQTLSI